MSGDIIIHPQGTYYNHPLYLQTAKGTGGVKLVVVLQVREHIQMGQCTWTPPVGSAGTYYYQCGSPFCNGRTSYCECYSRCLGQAGNHADPTCQQGSPNLEIFADNPRESTGYIAGWYREVLKGSRRTKPWDQGDRQIFPRTNTYFRP